MAHGAPWNDLREQYDAMASNALLVTPRSDRQFDIESITDDRVVIRFHDSDQERSLWREQFDVLASRLDDGPIAVDDLPSSVEPYASVLSLAPGFESDGETIRRNTDGSTGDDSPYLVSPSEARTRPERVHDDALLLADALDRVDATAPASLPDDELTDLYVLLSDVQRGSDRLRRSVGDPLLGRLGPDQELYGRFGTVHRTTRERRRPKDDETILDALDDHGIPHEWVLGVDPDKLDVVLAVTDLTEPEVYDVEEQVYVQKTRVDEEEKYSRLQGLSDRIEAVEGEDGETLRGELDALEERIDQALSTS